jgi:simple sugar transport system substrate-binding protein
MTPVTLFGALDEVQNAATFGAYLTAHPNIAGVFGSGDPTANAAAKVLSQRGIHMPVGTFDVDAEAINFIKQGWMTAAINQQPYLQGYGSVMDMYITTVLGLVPVNINTGTQIVTKDNVDALGKSIAAGTN